MLVVVFGMPVPEISPKNLNNSFSREKKNIFWCIDRQKSKIACLVSVTLKKDMVIMSLSI